MTHRYERTPTVPEIEAALAALLAAIEAQEELRLQIPKTDDVARGLSAADLAKMDPAVLKIENLVDDPVGRACREQIRELGTLLYRITGSTDAMCETLDRVAALDPERVHERTEMIDRWWGVAEDGHAVGCP